MAEQQAQQAPKTVDRGYPYLAKLWSKTQLGIARKYNDLAILNILYLQAELCQLEEDLAQEQQIDRASSGDGRYYDWDWWLMPYSNMDKDKKQWELVLKIRQTLHEYHHAILQYAQISSLRQPTESQRKDMFDIIGSASANDRLGRFRSFDLSGDDGPRVYERVYAHDLVLLDAKEEENDALSRFLVRPLLEIFHLFWQRNKMPMSKDLESAPVGENRTHVCLYTKHQFQMLNHIIGALFSAITPLASMVILYCIESMKVKLALVCVFTVIFTLALSTLSKACRIEIFAATAAFAARIGKWKRVSDNLDS
ncbi:hypothetical protein F5B20DRAFT_587883 [Whalleya microplaca]|nr:hypothetical protein F5B20DRAFT_587883 [Whalleya microplaca]